MNNYYLIIKISFNKDAHKHNIHIQYHVCKHRFHSEQYGIWPEYFKMKTLKNII